jgi:hypothetical protein
MWRAQRAANFRLDTVRTGRAWRKGSYMYIDPKALAPTPRWYTLRVRGGPSPQKEEWDKREEIAGEISRAISPLT